MVNLVAFLFQQEFTPEQTAAAGAIGLGMVIVWLAVVVLMIAAMWKVFEKAGEPGWAAIIPIYNLIVLLKIAGKPAWWVVLFLIPFVNIIIAFVAMIAFAAAYGKGAGFGIGLALLPIVFFPILAWGDSRYSRPVLATA